MKIQVASDLHFEFLKPRLGPNGLLPRVVDADILVLAGDIATGLDVVDFFADWPVPVIYVAGNHELYRQDITVIREGLRDVCAGTSIHFLDNEGVVVDGIRLLGSTLWTDYCLYEPYVPQQVAMAAAAKGLNDHRLIRLEQRAFSPADALEEHLTARDWLERELRAKFPGPTVVVTHHGPHARSVHPRYVDDVLSPAFCSDLSALLPFATLWVHGHVHDGVDYQEAGCRVVANPRGYPVGSSAEGEYAFENDDFRSTCVLEVRARESEDGYQHREKAEPS